MIFKSRDFSVPALKKSINKKDSPINLKQSDHSTLELKEPHHAVGSVGIGLAPLTLVAEAASDSPY